MAMWDWSKEWDADGNQLRSIIKVASIYNIVIMMAANNYHVIKMSVIDHDVIIDVILIIPNLNILLHLWNFM